MGPEVLQRRLAVEHGQTGHLAADERDVGLEEGEDVRPQRHVSHLLQHLVELGHAHRPGLSKGGWNE